MLTKALAGGRFQFVIVFPFKIVSGFNEKKKLVWKVMSMNAAYAHPFIIDAIRVKNWYLIGEAPVWDPARGLDDCVVVRYFST